MPDQNWMAVGRRKGCEFSTFFGRHKEVTHISQGFLKKICRLLEIFVKFTFRMGFICYLAAPGQLWVTVGQWEQPH